MDITPEEFRKRLYSRSSTPGGQERCPHCGRADIRSKTAATGRERSHDASSYCGQCMRHFDTSVRAHSIEEALERAEEVLDPAD